MFIKRMHPLRKDKWVPFLSIMSSSNISIAMNTAVCKKIITYFKESAKSPTKRTHTEMTGEGGGGQNRSATDWERAQFEKAFKNPASLDSSGMGKVRESVARNNLIPSTATSTTKPSTPQASSQQQEEMEQDDDTDELVDFLASLDTTIDAIERNIFRHPTWDLTFYKQRFVEKIDQWKIYVPQEKRPDDQKINTLLTQAKAQIKKSIAAQNRREKNLGQKEMKRPKQEPKPEVSKMAPITIKIKRWPNCAENEANARIRAMVECIAKNHIEETSISISKERMEASFLIEDHGNLQEVIEDAQEAINGAWEVVGTDQTSRVKSTNPGKTQSADNHSNFPNHNNSSKILDRLWVNDASPGALNRINIVDVAIAMKAEYELVKKRYGLREECKDAKEIARQVIIIIIIIANLSKLTPKILVEVITRNEDGKRVALISMTPDVHMSQW